MNYELELVAWKKNFYKIFRIGNSKCEVTLCNSIL